MLIHAWYAKQWCWRTYKIQKSLFLHSFANECALPTRSTFSIARNASSNHADQQFSISKMTAHWHCANNMTTTRLFIIKKKTVLQILCNETSTDFSLCIFTRWRSLISSAVFLALVTRLKQRRWWYTGLIKLVGPIRLVRTRACWWKFLAAHIVSDFEMKRRRRPWPHYIQQAQCTIWSVRDRI